MEKLHGAKIKKVIDIRLNNTSQLAGYAKKDDLAYVLELVGMDYEHLPELAPTEELLKSFKKKEIAWDAYEAAFLKQLKAMQNTKVFELIREGDSVCLLCSEDQPLHCHRRLVAEHYAKLHPGTTVQHL